MTLRIIGAGFGRTGTHSLKLALETLGFGPCYHMMECLTKGHQAAWERVHESGTADWDELLRGYPSAVDWPSAHFWSELAEHYPDARLILTVRDPERWYQSVLDTIYPLTPKAKEQRGLATKLIWQGVFGGRFEDKAHALEVFERHNETVKRSIDPARLLVFESSDGWEPLCRFLECDVPKEPYPHSNTTEAFQKRLAEMQAASSSPGMASRTSTDSG